MNSGGSPTTVLDFCKFSFSIFLLKNQNLIQMVSSSYSVTLTTLSVSLPSSGTYIPLTLAVRDKSIQPSTVVLKTPVSTDDRKFLGVNNFACNPAIIKNAFADTGVGYSNFSYSDYYLSYTDSTDYPYSNTVKLNLTCEGGVTFTQNSCFQINLYYLKIS